jgi:hypothetical protein
MKSTDHGRIGEDWVREDGRSPLISRVTSIIKSARSAHVRIGSKAKRRSRFMSVGKMRLSDNRSRTP